MHKRAEEKFDDAIEKMVAWIIGSLAVIGGGIWFTAWLTHR